MDFIVQDLKFELRTSSDFVPTSTVRTWTHFIRIYPPPGEQDSLEFWLQGLMNRHPTQIPKQVVLPKMIMLYKIT
jgi:hypothetical protein